MDSVRAESAPIPERNTKLNPTLTYVVGRCIWHGLRRAEASNQNALTCCQYFDHSRRRRSCEA